MLLLAVGNVSLADVVRVAVASNFNEALHAVSQTFEQQTGHELLVSSASTGKLYAQIKHGAPFDVFMSADTATAERLVSEGLAHADSLQAYALGQLVLLSNHNKQPCEQVLTEPNLRYFAIANPNTAPYGLAARQVLQKLQLWHLLEPKLVMGENIAQTMQFVYSQNADAGLVARSLIVNREIPENQCVWVVPETHYQPIKQSLVVLNAASDKPAVQQLMAFLAQADVRKLISDFGYAQPQ